MANEVWAGAYDSGTGWYIWDELDGKYKVATTFWGQSNGVRVSSHIDDIAQNVAAMGPPTLADKILAGLKTVGPNADDLTIRIIAEDR